MTWPSHEFRSRSGAAKSSAWPGWSRRRTELAEALFGLRPSWRASAYDGTRTAITSPAAAIRAGLLLDPEDRRYHGLIVERPFDTTSACQPGPLRSCRMVARAAEKKLSQEMVARLQIRTPSIDQQTGLLSGATSKKSCSPSG